MDGLVEAIPLAADWKRDMRVPYGLRRVPPSTISSLLPLAASPQEGRLALARLEKLGKNTGLEMVDGRRCALHEGDLLAVVFGNRYATAQFEGYVGADGDRCDLLSMGGLCGLFKSKHANVLDPTRLRLLGFLGDADGLPLCLEKFALPPNSNCESAARHCRLRHGDGRGQNAHRHERSCWAQARRASSGGQANGYGVWPRCLEHDGRWS